MDFEKLRFHGHADKFTNWGEPHERMFWAYGAYKKTPIYAWMTGSGVLLGTIDKVYERVLAQKEEIQKLADLRGEVVRLIEFHYENTKERLLPPPDPDEEKIPRGGHAVGGPPDVDTLEDVVGVFNKILKRQYAAADQVAVGIEDDVAFVRHLNVKCWVKKCNDQGKDDYLRERRWSAYVSMVRRWNYDYHDVHVGSFFSADDAIHAALSAFVYYQMIEQHMEDY